MTDPEAHLKLALEAVRRAADRPEAADIKCPRLAGGAVLCTWAAAQLMEQYESLVQITLRQRRR